MRLPTTRFTAVEILQTSAMDCGPAAAASLLASLGRPVDLAALREACQTDLDGTSIDVIEAVLAREGLEVAQKMLPAERLGDALPALVVVRLPDGAPHFVVAWRRIGPFVQVMDPARGGRWLRMAALEPQLLRHSQPVPADAWRAWAREEENMAPLRAEARALGLDPARAERAAAEPGWFPLAAFEACLRLVRAMDLDRARRVPLFEALLAETRQAEDDIFRLVPPEFWPVVPDPDLTRDEAPRVLLKGAVLIATRAGSAAAADRPFRAHRPRRTGICPPLFATGRIGPLGLMLGTLLAVLGSLAEAMAFRGLIEPASAGVAVGLSATLALMAGLYALRLTLGAAVLRLGRAVEARLRGASFAKILRLPDRWHASRPLGDLAERAQSLHLTRNLPGLALHLVQAMAEVVALTAGLLILAPGSAALILALAGLALAWPFLVAPLLRDRDLVLRGLGAAQAGVMLDALQGQAALAAHHGAPALRARNETLLADWAAAAWTRARWAAGLVTLGQAGAMALAAGLILGQAAAPDLLVMWWIMKLPGAAGDLADLIRQLPAQEAVLARIEGTLQAPELADASLPPALARPPALEIELSGIALSLAGHPVLNGLDLAVAAGEAVAVVGASGSGKSSLLGLILGWYRPSAGGLRLGGEAPDEATHAALRARMVWADPTARIWTGTLAGLLGPDAADRLARVGLDLPGDTPTGAGGALLSAGEGQRLRLAQALGRPDPALVLCDEALRGLDRPLRLRLLDRLRQDWAGRTVIWVTHDMEEALRFPRVVVMAEGRIVEDGAPEALLAAGGAFAALVAEARALETRLDRAWRRVAVEDFHVQPAA